MRKRRAERSSGARIRKNPVRRGGPRPVSRFSTSIREQTRIMRCDDENHRDGDDDDDTPGPSDMEEGSRGSQVVVPVLVLVLDPRCYGVFRDVK